MAKARNPPRSASVCEVALGGGQKHLKLASIYRDKVASGFLSAGDRLPTYAELKLEHGVSQDVLDKMHRLLEAEGLILREARRGTFVRGTQGNRGAIKGIIGFLGVDETTVSDTSCYWSPMVQGMRSAAIRLGLEILLLHRDSVVHEDKVDGVLVISNDCDATLGQLPLGLPRVSLLVESQMAPSVVSDDFVAVTDLVNHAVALGHRRIGYLTFHDGYPSALRLQAYQTALLRAGIQPLQAWAPPLAFEQPRSGFTARGRFNMHKWLQNVRPDELPTALLAHNDDTALGMLEVLEEAGFRVPQDISLMGFDGLMSVEHLNAGLTTAQVPLQEIGAQGIRLLWQQLLGRAAPAVTRLPAPVVPGRTSGPVCVKREQK